MSQKVEIIGLGEKNKIKTAHLRNFSWFKSKLAVRYNQLYALMTPFKSFGRIYIGFLYF